MHVNLQQRILGMLQREVSSSSWAGILFVNNVAIVSIAVACSRLDVQLLKCKEDIGAAHVPQAIGRHIRPSMSGCLSDGAHLREAVKGRKRSSPFHKSLRQDLPHMLPSNARQGCIISRVGPAAHVSQQEAAHIYDGA